MALAVVTGAWSFLGKRIAQELLTRGEVVRTLTTRQPPRPDPFDGIVQAWPLTFSTSTNAPTGLIEGLQDVQTLYNTYWVRHDRPPVGHRGPWTSHGEAARRSCQLIDAANAAGVKRIVHISITQPDAASPLSYFQGKAMVERHLRTSGLSHAILRPSCFFGGGDILINNIAWAVRRFPLFLLPRPLGYQVRPIHVGDMARIACDWGECTDNVTRDACGPEQYRFDDLVRRLGSILTGREPRIVALPSSLCFTLYQGASVFLRDTVLSLAELQGLSSDLLRSDEEPLGTTVLSEWAAARADSLGLDFHPEPRRSHGG